MRKKIIAANWKMHKTIAETVDFLHRMKGHLPQASNFEAWVAPPFTSLHAAAETVKKENLPILIGGQNMHEASQGAFTGEISSAMLKDAGANFCIVGHSERRHLFHETDEQIAAKVRKGLEAGLTILLCVGEHEAERDSGEYMNLIELQLASGLAGVATSHFKKLVIAYEPVWAIGTGKTATPEIAQETQRKIREFLGKRWGESLANTLSILYGGSVNSANAAELASQPDIDGVLIGGASLEAKTFLEILNKVVKA